MPTLIIQPVRPVARLHQPDWGTKLAVRWRALHRRWTRRGQRDALRAIADDPHMLSDLGLTRQQALDEADRPFWR